MLFNMVGKSGGSPSPVEKLCYTANQTLTDQNKRPKYLYTITFAKSGEYDINFGISGSIRSQSSDLYDGQVGAQRLDSDTELNISGGTYSIKDSSYTPGQTTPFYANFHIATNQANAVFTMKFNTPFPNPGSDSKRILITVRASIWCDPILAPSFNTTLTGQTS